MEQKKKPNRIWSLILLVGFIFFISGTVAGVKELFNRKTVSMSLSSYMETLPDGARLNLSECKRNSSLSISHTWRSGRTRRKNQRDYFLLEPKEEASNFKAYIFITNNSDGIENKTLDSLGYHSISGWVQNVSNKDVIKKARNKINNTEAEIVFVESGIKSLTETVYYPLIVAFICFAFLFARGYRNYKKSEMVKIN